MNAERLAPFAKSIEKVNKLCQEGQLRKALDVVKSMVLENNEAPTVAYVMLLKECGRRKALTEGKQVHSLIVQSGRHDSNPFLANHVMNMYSKCGSVLDADKVFAAMPRRNVFSWTAIIAAYADSRNYMKAIDLFQQMEESGIVPDRVACLVALKSCARTANLVQGKQLHSLMLKLGLELDVNVQNTLVDMYAKCGCLDDAQKIFDEMQKRDVVSWTTMIAGYTQRGDGKGALALYEQMKQEGLQGDMITYIAALQACAGISALEQGKQIHSLIVKRGLKLDVVVQSTLVDMYAKCGCLEVARKLFDNMNERNVVSWNAMITGYAQKALGKEALALYEQMKEAGVEADRVTFISVLKACGSIGALEQGKQLHALLLEEGIELDVNVQTTLVDMYAKCGCLEDARKVFNNMKEQSAVSWSVMIAGYAQNGLGKEALALLEQMNQHGVQADEITFTCVLSALRHSGLVQEGCHVFDFMLKYSGVMPTMEHYACMIDLLGRARCFAKAEALIKNMPMEPDSVIWTSLLGAARNHGDVEMGQLAFDHLVKLEPENAAAYLMLIELCTTAGRKEKAAEVKKEMAAKRLGKVPGGPYKLTI